MYIVLLRLCYVTTMFRSLFNLLQQFKDTRDYRRVRRGAFERKKNELITLVK